MSWYLKYRPHQISDLDLVDVRRQLESMMEHGKFPQTLIFAGPKGTGKTSASRIIGAMLNDPKNEKAVEQIFFKDSGKTVKLKEPDAESEFAQRVFRGSSYVVQEMDAASHRGIDDIRQLRERINLPPQEGKMAVYILDEVHMLTNEAFNALLKILEEPPPHVVFILATTEMHKVPATIISRCSVVNFHKASLDELTGRLNKILKLEKVNFESEALSEIARRADGSFRDAVKLAEIASHSGEITLKQVASLIGGSALVEVKKLTEMILAKDEERIAGLFQELRQRNFDQDYFYQSLYGFLHQNLLGAIGAIDYQPQLDKKVAQFLLSQIMQIDLSQATPIAFLPLELKLLLIVQRAKEKSSGGTGQKSSEPSNKKASDETDGESETKTSSNKKQPKETGTDSKLKKNSSTNKKKIGEKNLVNTDNVQAAAGAEAATTTSKESEAKIETKNTDDQPGKDSKETEIIADSADSLSQRMCDCWEDFLQLVQNRNHTLAALLRSSQPQSGKNGETKIGVYYQFHKEQLQQSKYRKIIEDCGQQLIGSKINFKIILKDLPSRANLVDVPAKTDSLEALAEEALM